VRIIAATLNAVAAVARRIINREKVRWLLNATRFAMKEETFMLVRKSSEISE